MKKFSFLLPILLFFVAIGCYRDDDSNYAYFSSSDISVYADSTTYFVTVYATNVEWWSVTQDTTSTSWLTFNGDNMGYGSDNGLMVLSFPPNTDTLDREATFTLQYMIDTVTTTTMTFTHLAQTQIININTDTVFVSSSAQVVNIDVDANVEWGAILDWSTIFDVSWAKAMNNGITTRLMVENTLQVEVEENTSNNYRVTNVNLVEPYMGVDTMVVLFQAGLGTLDSDKAVLMNLYESAGGENWTNKWDLSTPVSTWYGVSTGIRGGAERVLTVSLANNNLVGTIPSTIGDLAYLEMLALQNNDLSGEIPIEVGYLYEVRYLYLLNNNFEGEIPYQIFKMPRVERIHLGGNQLSGEIPETIGELATLKVFCADNNNLTGTLPESLGSTETLETFIVSGNRLSGEIPSDYFINDLWSDWDYPTTVCPQQSGYGFDNCN